MPANRFVSGQWNIICDSCGLKKKSSQVRKRWDGLIVCADTCYEQDHPQKYIRVRETGIAVPFIRDEPADLYKYVCTIWGSSGYADLCVADCAAADGNNTTYAFALSFYLESLGNFIILDGGTAESLESFIYNGGDATTISPDSIHGGI